MQQNIQLYLSLNVSDGRKISDMKSFQDMTSSAETLFSACGNPPATAFTRQHGIHTMMPFDQFKR